ncbi:MAG: hypothetical protein GXP27_17715 [Planctomycetes bacterium]|nr:hypothetical protein [Planctomycetota bacterium]
MKYAHGPLGGKDAFGSALNRQTAKINRAVFELGDCSVEDVVNYVKRVNGVELLELRVSKHFMWLTGADDRGQFEKAGFGPFAVRTEKGGRLTEEARARYMQWLERQRLA